jgi:3-phosphoshikimate 1-carboxyvinyltransferase
VKLCNMAKVGMSSTVRILGPGRMSGVLNLPGDKSISHRVAMLAALAAGPSTIGGFASSADCASTLGCIQQLGVEVERARQAIVIRGRGLRGLAPSSERARLDAGNSGSTMRMLAGILAAQPFTSELDGDPSLRRRPMRRIIEPLSLMGSTIEAREENFPPLTITGGPLRAISYNSPVASAQVKTCVLLAGLFAEGATSYAEPAASRNHTELMLGEFGAAVEIEAGDSARVTVQGGTELTPLDYEVPGDLSSAAFFVAGATVLPGSQIVLRRVGLNPTRTAFIEVLNSLGASIKKQNVTSYRGELIGDLVVTSSTLRTDQNGTVISGPMIPNLIDEIPVLAVLATQVEGRVEVRGARELRIKESDRIRSVVSGIRALGGQIEEFDDGFGIEGPRQLTGGRVDSAGDHRIAMAFSIAGLIASGSTEIVEADCAAVSCPEFYELLKAVAGSNAIDTACAYE